MQNHEPTFSPELLLIRNTDKGAPQGRTPTMRPLHTTTTACNRATNKGCIAYSEITLWTYGWTAQSSSPLGHDDAISFGIRCWRSHDFRRPGPVCQESSFSVQPMRLLCYARCKTAPLKSSSLPGQVFSAVPQVGSSVLASTSPANGIALPGEL